MDILNIMIQRHSVRVYEDKSIEDDKKEILNDLIKNLNIEYGTNVQIVYDDAELFSNSEASYGRFSGCKNIVALVAKNAEIAGYVGELVVLKAQEIGLNTCFVALTYNKGAVKRKIRKEAGEKIQCCIAIGYGKNQGKRRTSKTLKDVLILKGEKPEFLEQVVEACLLAPTAINQQKFKVVSTDGNIDIKKSGIGFYTDVDLGIIKCHKDLILKEYMKK